MMRPKEAGARGHHRIPDGSRRGADARVVERALVKAGADRFAFTIVLTLRRVPDGARFGAILSHDLAALPWLLLSSALHVAYMLFLIEAYAHGDLAQIYPLSRGSAPLIVAVAGALFLNEALSASKFVAVLCIALGVVAMSLRGGGDLGRMSGRALGYALATASCTAAYTVMDAIGARASGSASAYTCAMFSLVRRRSRSLSASAGAAPRPCPSTRVWRLGALAGGLSFLAYWAAVWAFTKAPVALVAALRETSVLMAMLIGVVFLRESGSRWRWAAAGMIGAGVALMRL